MRSKNAKMTRYFNLVEFFCGVCILLGYDIKLQNKFEYSR